MRSIVCSFIVFSAVVFCAGAASADDSQGFGTLAGLQVNTTSADAFLQYHGRILVKNSGGTLDEYRWGGASCGTKLLTEAQVASLQAGLDNKRMVIEPLTLPGQGQVPCLVGFNLVLKSNLKLLAP